MPENNESKILGVSSRGWLAFIVIATVCGMSACKIEITEPLNAMVHVMIGFYFSRLEGVKK